MSGDYRFFRSVRAMEFDLFIGNGWRSLPWMSVSSVADNSREQIGGDAAPKISGLGTAGHTDPGQWIGRPAILA
jgi:hypothetical protein